MSSSSEDEGKEVKSAASKRHHDDVNNHGDNKSAKSAKKSKGQAASTTTSKSRIAKQQVMEWKAVADELVYLKTPMDQLWKSIPTEVTCTAFDLTFLSMTEKKEKSWKKIMVSHVENDLKLGDDMKYVRLQFALGKTSKHAEEEGKSESIHIDKIDMQYFKLYMKHVKTRLPSDPTRYNTALLYDRLIGYYNEYLKERTRSKCQLSLCTMSKCSAGYASSHEIDTWLASDELEKDGLLTSSHKCLAWYHSILEEYQLLIVHGRKISFTVPVDVHRRQLSDLEFIPCLQSYLDSIINVSALRRQLMSEQLATSLVKVADEVDYVLVDSMELLISNWMYFGETAMSTLTDAVRTYLHSLHLRLPVLLTSLMLPHTSKRARMAVFCFLYWAERAGRHGLFPSLPVDLQSVYDTRQVLYQVRVANALIPAESYDATVSSLVSLSSSSSSSSSSTATMSILLQQLMLLPTHAEAKASKTLPVSDKLRHDVLSSLEQECQLILSDTVSSTSSPTAASPTGDKQQIYSKDQVEHVLNVLFKKHRLHRPCLQQTVCSILVESLRDCCQHLPTVLQQVSITSITAAQLLTVPSSSSSLSSSASSTIIHQNEEIVEARTKMKHWNDQLMGYYMFLRLLLWTMTVNTVKDPTDGANGAANPMAIHQFIPYLIHVASPFDLRQAMHMMHLRLVFATTSFKHLYVGHLYATSRKKTDTDETWNKEHVHLTYRYLMGLLDLVSGLRTAMMHPYVDTFNATLHSELDFLTLYEGSTAASASVSVALEKCQADYHKSLQWMEKHSAIVSHWKEESASAKRPLGDDEIESSRLGDMDDPRLHTWIETHRRLLVADTPTLQAEMVTLLSSD